MKGCKVLGLLDLEDASTVVLQNISILSLNTLTAIVDLSQFNNSCLKSRQRRP